MHQHPVMLIRAQFIEALQPTEYRIATFTTARRKLHASIASAGQRRPVGIVRRNANHQTSKCRVVQKTIEGVFDNAALTQQQILLGTICAHTTADAGSRNDDPEGRLIAQAHSIS